MKKATTKFNVKKKDKPLASQLKKRELIKALASSLGNVTEATRAVGIDRSTYYKWLKEDPDFAQSIEEVNDEQIDYVESKLLQRINEGDTTATIYYLKTKGKRRGWSEKLEIEAKLSPFERLMMDTEE